LHNIGSVKNEQGEYKAALYYYNLALKIYEKVYGDNHPSTATTLNNIGSVKDGQGEYNDALDYYTKALKIYLNFYNSNHPSIKLTQHNINICHQSSKNDSASNK